MKKDKITRLLNADISDRLDRYPEPEESPSVGWMILWSAIIILGTCVLLETAHYLNWYIN